MSLSRRDLLGKQLAKRALDHPADIKTLAVNISAQDSSTSHPAAIALRILSEQVPRRIYPYWSAVTPLLKNPNAFLQANALLIIANLIPIDAKSRFEEIFDEYFQLFRDRSIMIANYLAGVGGKIARAKPHLQPKITEYLLTTDQLFPRRNRHALIKSYVIDALNEYYDNISDKPRILAFVEQQLTSSSPRTRQKAKAFLDRWRT